MLSLKARMLRLMLRYRHLLKGHLRRPVITFDTPLADLRADTDGTSARLAKPPEGVTVTPADVAGMAGEWICPEGCTGNAAILYFHGGGFVMGSIRGHRALVAGFARRCGVRALTFEYRLAPEHPFPAAVEDGAAAYRWLLNQGVAPEHIVMAGDSAGGGLMLAALLWLRDRGVPLPAAAVVFSPCTDITASGASHKTRLRADPCTPPGANEVYMGYYRGTGDPTDPYMSPLFGDLHGLPPLMIQVGDCETLLDDSVRFAQKARAAGVDARLHVWPGLFHCFPLLAPMFPEATAAMDEVCAFVREHLPLTHQEE